MVFQGLVKFVVVLFAVDNAVALWCSPKEKLSPIDQLKALSKARQECFTKTTVQPKNSSERYCPVIFDNVLCWKNTKAGTIAYKQCPSYIHGFDTSGYAFKECLDNGEWYTHPMHNRTYTNFSGCITNRNTISMNKPQTIAELIKDHMHAIQILYRVGYSLSLAFLIVAVFIMTILSKLRCQRNIIHLNLFISFICRCVICLIKDDHGIPEEETDIMSEVAKKMYPDSSTSLWCKTVHVLFFYILVANYVWVFLEGVYLHTLIFITTFHKISRKVFKALIVIGWVSPVLCVVPWAIVRSLHDNTLCWNIHSPENGYIWIIQGPIVATLAINFAFFLNIIRVLFTKLSAANTRDPKRYRKLAKSTLVLIPLFGVHYILFYIVPICLEPKLEMSMMYTELFFSSFQGVIVSMLFCYLNDEVQNEIMKHWKWQMLRRQSLVSSRSTRTFSLPSSGSMKELESPNMSDKKNTSFIVIRSSHSSTSLARDNIVSQNSEIELCQNQQLLPDNTAGIPSIYKDTNDNNETVPFISGEKATFF